METVINILMLIMLVLFIVIALLMLVMFVKAVVDDAERKRETAALIERIRKDLDAAGID